MAKALTLNPDTLSIVASVPQAAQGKSSMDEGPKPAGEKARTKIRIEREPLQVRWPMEDLKAVKLAALELDSSVSDFLLACFHAYRKDDKV